MKLRSIALGLTLVVSSGCIAAAAAPAGAQAVVAQAGPRAVPEYQTWQPGWDRDQYNRRNVILGTVTSFSPYRLQIARPNGAVQTIDLKGGTIILPTGTTPMPNERVAIVGYYSRGTFIANRVLVHP